jgi:cell division protein FtsQ
MARDFERPADVEMEPTYRRRPKAVPVSRRHSSTPRRVLIWAARATLLIVLLAAAALPLAWYVLNSPRFQLSGTDAVIVTGNHFVSQAEVAVAVGAGAQPSLFRLSLDEARRQVETISWVRTASLRRVYPNRLQVDIIERKPIAFVNLGSGVKLVDEDGVTLEKPAESNFDFPVLTGLETSMSLADRRARLALFEQFAQELKLRVNGAGWVVSEADLSDLADLKALLVEGRQTILVHFGDRDFGQRFDTFLALLPQVERASPSVDAVDLRFHDQVVVIPKEPANAKAEVKKASR